MTYDPDNITDPLNLIKQCPDCKKIWIKVSGCDGLAFCGDKPASYDES